MNLLIVVTITNSITTNSISSSSTVYTIHNQVTKKARPLYRPYHTNTFSSSQTSPKKYTNYDAQKQRLGLFTRKIARHTKKRG